jgi:hypothetical protein
LTEPNKAIEEPASSAPSHPLSAEQAKLSATEGQMNMVEHSDSNEERLV